MADRMSQFASYFAPEALISAPSLVDCKLSEGMSENVTPLRSADNLLTMRSVNFVRETFPKSEKMQAGFGSRISKSMTLMAHLSQI